MIRISKLTDYGIVLLTHLANGNTSYTARDLAEESNLPLPTVGKLLKILSKGELLGSWRGAAGGYRLARRPEEITIAEIIEVLEGPVAITECSDDEGLCGLESVCPVRTNWQKINGAVFKALEGLTLADMRKPLPLKVAGRSR